MQPSSLVFLVLIVTWAVYLLQHWVRRREYLATARSVDRFSAAMRVLERRNPLPEVELSAQGQRSYAVSPARPSHPEVVVERAQPPRPDVSMESSPVVRPTRFFRFLAGMSARRLRGLSLLASLSLVLLVSALAAFSALPVWSALVALVIVVGDLMWLRHVAVSEAADGWGRDQAVWGRETKQGTTLQPAEVGHSPHRGLEADLERPFSSKSQAPLGSKSEVPFDSESEPRVVSGSRSQAGSGSDPTLVIPAPDAAELTQPTELPAVVDPSGWAPVPVPPPTYTLKAKAAEPVVAPAEISDPAAGVCWSLDGMVYDCELDELVERRSATGA